MCTCLLGGKKTSIDGSVLFAANDDWTGVPGVLTHVPAKVHTEGAFFQLTGGKRLPQPAETNGYVYTACKYETGMLDRSWAGGINDCRVAVAGTGVNAYKQIPCEGAWLEPDDIPLLILERARTARGGIQMIGELIKIYNFQPSTMEGSPSVACFAVADESEAWWLEMAPGNHWLAVRVPDDEVSVRVNAFGTHDADLLDSENVMFSEGLADYARSQGWWDGDDRHFDFANVYGHTVSLNEWGPELADMNMRRRWRAVNLFSGQETPEDALLYSVYPKKQLDIRDMMAVLRDVYDGTCYDLRKAAGAGVFGNPFHENPPDYSLSHAETVAGIVAALKSESLPVLWTCMATPRISFYFPVYADIENLPLVCEAVEEEPSLYWEFKKLGMLTCICFERCMPVLEKLQERYECAAMKEISERNILLKGISRQTERRKQMTLFTEEQIEEGRQICREAKQILGSITGVEC